MTETRVSRTENQIQLLMAELWVAGITEERKKTIKEEIQRLKQTPEGQADQKKHDTIMQQE